MYMGGRGHPHRLLFRFGSSEDQRKSLLFLLPHVGSIQKKIETLKWLDVFCAMAADISVAPTNTLKMWKTFRFYKPDQELEGNVS